ncbi:UNVERIFIED_CONTAM: hypothetical protein PYX00_000568 [Menopon gallinae]|uniref:HNH homing endonuclease n=1 Tax=Menopon gallinae TaxID=328185 RepID=A0AAW2IAJ2_9NEOP
MIPKKHQLPGRNRGSLFKERKGGKRNKLKTWSRGIFPLPFPNRGCLYEVDRGEMLRERQEKPQTKDAINGRVGNPRTEKKCRSLWSEFTPEEITAVRKFQQQQRLRSGNQKGMDVTRGGRPERARYKNFIMSTVQQQAVQATGRG